jgi:putative hydrolase of HD superfamily
MLLEKEIEFILAVDALKNVNRRNFNLDDARRENTAEHSWQVVVFAQILYPHARNKEKIDLGKVLKMLSIHDIVEIDAGDTFFYDEKANEDKFERELASAKRIFGILSEPLRSEFMDLWLEFEAGETEDAIFANAVDRMIPFTLNCHNNGTSWTEAEVTLERVSQLLRGKIEQASEKMAHSFDVLLQKAFEEGKLL